MMTTIIHKLFKMMKFQQSNIAPRYFTPQHTVFVGSRFESGKGILQHQSVCLHTCFKPNIISSKHNQTADIITKELLSTLCKGLNLHMIDSSQASQVSENRQTWQLANLTIWVSPPKATGSIPYGINCDENEHNSCAVANYSEMERHILPASGIKWISCKSCVWSVQ